MTTKWTKEDGSTVVHDESTGRTYSITDHEGGYLIRGVSRGGRAKSAICQVAGKPQAVLEVLNHLATGKARVDGAA